MEFRQCIRWLAPAVLVALSATSVSARHGGFSMRRGAGAHFRAGHSRVGFGHFHAGPGHRQFGVSLRFGAGRRHLGARHFPFYPGHFGFSDRHWRLDERRRQFLFRTRPFVHGRSVFTSRVLSPVFFPPYYPAHYVDPYSIYPPPVIIIGGDREADERRGDDRYYLDPDRRERDSRPPEESRTREGLSGLLTRHLRIEIAEPGIYRVQWTGPTADLAGVSYRSLGKEGRTLDSEQPAEPPFRGLLRVPEETTAIEVSLQYASGGSAVLNLPIAEFKRLGRRDARRN